MAYSAITTAEVTAKEPVTTTLLTKVKDNFDDINGRVEDLENTGLTLPAVQFLVIGHHWHLGATSGLCLVRAEYAMTLTGVLVIVGSGGSSGTLEIDIRKSAAGGGAFSTILSTRPTVAAGSYGVSSNGVVNPSAASVSAGDLFLLDIVSVMVGCPRFSVHLTHQVA